MELGTHTANGFLHLELWRDWSEAMVVVDVGAAAWWNVFIPIRSSLSKSFLLFGIVLQLDIVLFFPILLLFWPRKLTDAHREP